MIIKICGITSLEDALLAIESGANALGFNFYSQSPRYLTPEQAAAIIKEIPEDVLTVGIFVGTPAEATARLCQVAQLHGFQHEQDIPPLSGRVWVATEPRKCRRFPNFEVIIDSSWGRGELADWDAVRRLRRPFILSGGLDPGNVYRAIRELRPSGVDVCSGVEQAPGRKDAGKLRRFLAQAHLAASSISPEQASALNQDLE